MYSGLSLNATLSATILLVICVTALASGGIFCVVCRVHKDTFRIHDSCFKWCCRAVGNLAQYIFWCVASSFSIEIDKCFDMKILYHSILGARGCFWYTVHMQTLHEKNQIRDQGSPTCKKIKSNLMYRGISAACTNELVAKGRKPQEMLSDEETLAVITRLAKQRKDSIEQFHAGGREDLVIEETAQLKVLEVFLPL